MDSTLKASSIEIKKLAVLGPGLLGGSVALAAKKYLQCEVGLWGRSPEKAEQIQRLGLFDEVSSDLKKIISDADLIVLAVPVTCMAALTESLLQCGLKKNQLVTDVGSVKASVETEVGDQLRSTGHRFIGSHPMAGSDQAGFDAASEDLFINAACIITPDKDSEDAQFLTSFWSSLGGKVTEMNAQHHDQVVARVSHFPHLLASVCAEVALKDESNGEFAGGGLRDSSRVASGDAGLWEGILTENAAGIVPLIEESINLLNAYKDSLSRQDGNQLNQLLSSAKQKRDSLN